MIGCWSRRMLVCILMSFAAIAGFASLMPFSMKILHGVFSSSPISVGSFEVVRTTTEPAGLRMCPVAKQTSISTLRKRASAFANRVGKRDWVTGESYTKEELASLAFKRDWVKGESYTK